jgi:hypothetical protein
MGFPHISSGPIYINMNLLRFYKAWLAKASHLSWKNEPFFSDFRNILDLSSVAGTIRIDATPTTTQFGSNLTLGPHLP